MKLLAFFTVIFLFSLDAYSLANQLKVISFSPLQFAISKSEINKIINSELTELGEYPINQSGFEGSAYDFSSQFTGHDVLQVDGRIKGKYKTLFGDVGINGTFQVEGVLRVSNWQYYIDVTNVDVNVSNELVDFLLGTFEAIADSAIKSAVEKALNKEDGSFINFEEAHPIAMRIHDAGTLEASFDSSNLILTLRQR